jgi:hypothetical protein
MASLFTIDHLRKPELMFELRARGLKDSGTVVDLRKRLRVAIADGVDYNGDAVMENLILEYQQCIITVEAIKSDYEELPTGENKADSVKIKNRTLTLVKRISFLQSLTEEGTEQHKSYEALLKEIAKFQQELDLSHTPKPNVTEQPDYVKQQTDSINKNNQPIVTNVVKQFSLFNEMPQPLRNSLSNIKKINGTITNELLKFLQTCIDILDQYPTVEQELLIYCRPYTEEPLKTILLNNTHTQKFAEFHRAAVKDLIPERLYDELVRTSYKRLQRRGEKLIDYVADIRAANRLLCLQHAETQIVGTIIKGVVPEIKRMYSADSKPTTFAALHSLSLSILEDEYNDSVRETQPEHTTTSPKENRTPVICDYCKKKGHTSQTCFAKQRSKYKNQTNIPNFPYNRNSQYYSKNE